MTSSISCEVFLFIFRVALPFSAITPRRQHAACWRLGVMAENEARPEA
jgi:hypothetical protein